MRTASCSASPRTCSMSTCLASSCDIMLTRSSAWICSWRAWASSSLGLVQLALARDQLAVAFLEHVSALVELLVALEHATLEVRHLLALGARLIVGLAGELDLLVLGLENQVLLLRACLGNDASGLVLRGADCLRGPERPRHETNTETDGDGH